jgi:uncharacterized DUF497 family protein
MRFEWNEAKSLANLRKHGLSFEDVLPVFDDLLRQTKPDRYINGEERWQTIGRVGEYRIVLVAHTNWDAVDGEEVIRIISARRVTRHERREYETENS